MSRSWLLGVGLAVAIAVWAMAGKALGEEAPAKALPVAKKAPSAGTPASTAKAVLREPAQVHGALPPQPAAIKIAEALASPAQLEFVEAPLQDVVDYLKDYHHIEIQLDRKAFEEAGIGFDRPVTKNLKAISLQSALRLLLRDLGLTYVIRDEVLLITTPDAHAFTTKIYNVADLVVRRDKQGREQDDYKALVNAITQTVEPQSWQKNGGNGGIAAATFGKSKVLSVSQTQAVHQEIERFLENVRAAK